MFPEGVRPNPPINPAHKSETISPYKLGMTMMSQDSGCIVNFIHMVSTCFSSYSICGYSWAISLAHLRNKPSPSFITPALCTATTFFLLFETAYSNAYLAIFNQALLEIILILSLTPGTTRCSSPIYSPSVFSLIVTTFTLL